MRFLYLGWEHCRKWQCSMCMWTSDWPWTDSGVRGNHSLSWGASVKDVWEAGVHRNLIQLRPGLDPQCGVPTHVFWSCSGALFCFRQGGKLQRHINLEESWVFQDTQCFSKPKMTLSYKCSHRRGVWKGWGGACWTNSVGNCVMKTQSPIEIACISELIQTAAESSFMGVN